MMQHEVETTAPVIKPSEPARVHETRNSVYVIQHRIGQDGSETDWPQESVSFQSPEAAIATMREHEDWYPKGHIRVVRKTTRTLVEVTVAEVVAE